MKFLTFFALFLATMSAVASEMAPSTTAQIVANKDSPTKFYLVVIVENANKPELYLALPNDVDDRFEILNLIVTTPDGTPIPESDLAKEIKSRELKGGGSNLRTIKSGKSFKFIIPLSNYFSLPVRGGFTVTGHAKDLITKNDKSLPLEFKVTNPATE